MFLRRISGGNPRVLLREPQEYSNSAKETRRHSYNGEPTATDAGGATCCTLGGTIWGGTEHLWYSGRATESRTRASGSPCSNTSGFAGAQAEPSIPPGKQIRQGLGHMGSCEVTHRNRIKRRALHYPPNEFSQLEDVLGMD